MSNFLTQIFEASDPYQPEIELEDTSNSCEIPRVQQAPCVTI